MTDCADRDVEAERGEEFERVRRGDPGAGAGRDERGRPLRRDGACSARPNQATKPIAFCETVPGSEAERVRWSRVRPARPTLAVIPSGSSEAFLWASARALRWRPLRSFTLARADFVYVGRPAARSDSAMRPRLCVGVSSASPSARRFPWQSQRVRFRSARRLAGPTRRVAALKLGERKCAMRLLVVLRAFEVLGGCPRPSQCERTGVVPL